MTSDRDEFIAQLLGTPSNVVTLPVRLAPVKAPSKATSEAIEDDPLAPVPLGFDKQFLYYLSRETLQVHELSPQGHMPNSFLHMSPESFWSKKFPGDKGKINWQGATDWMMTNCRRVGVFNPDRLRGRGVAFDNGRVVLHLGNKLIVDGIPQDSLALNNSEFIYEKSRTMHVGLGVPLSDAEAYKIIECANMFSWGSRDMGLLLAGWIVTAPICGALPWRTHLWLTGQAGSGKSYIMSHFIKPLIGSIGFYIQSKTTEAGIRQHLKIDARPVIFDESDTQNDADRSRLQQILDIARQASSDDGFQILKGTANGREMKFRIQSSFLFSSINFGAIQAADESRIIPVTLIQMEQNDAAIKFDKIKQAVLELLTPDFSGRLLARTLQLLPTIRSNIHVFVRALSEHYSSRQADTIGSVLAGVYSLFSSSSLTYAEAQAFIKNKEWIQQTVDRTTTEFDHFKAVAHLMEQIIRHTPSQEYSISEAIILTNSNPDHEIRNTLMRLGIKVKDGIVYFARGHSSLNEFFENTPWAKVWNKTFTQWSEAKDNETTVDFGGIKKRAVVIPLASLVTPP